MHTFMLQGPDTPQPERSSVTRLIACTFTVYEILVHWDTFYRALYAEMPSLLPYPHPMLFIIYAHTGAGALGCSPPLNWVLI
jgi:hypothetical protein